jgi:hypothetical protein
MIFRLIFLLSMVPIAVVLALRWWHGTRVLAGESARTCRCDLSKWLPPVDDSSVVHRAEGNAVEFGADLRKKAMDAWEVEHPAAFRARYNARRFGMAVPPLSCLIALLAVIAMRIPPIGLVVIPLAATAVAGVLAVMSLPGELAAIARHIAKVGRDRAFPDRDDEASVFRCAVAHAWDLALPPILRWLHK